MAAGVFSFGPFAFDRKAVALFRDGHEVPLGQRALTVLGALIDGLGRTLGKRELLETVWSGASVADVNLAVQITALRKALGKRPDGGEWIVNVPRVGYRLAQNGVVRTSQPAGLPVIGVLPFQNLSDDPAQEYFADGVVDDLITELSRFRSFAVLGRSSSFAFKGQTGTAPDLARQMDVDYLLEGSVRRAGGRLRIVTQLVDGSNGSNLWSEVFDGSVDDVFEFQDRITASVAALVEPRIQQAEIDRSRRERPDSMDGYDLYLRAVRAIYSFTAEGNFEAIALLEQALLLEPENGLYMGYITWALELRSTMNWPLRGPDDRARCMDYARRAVKLAYDDATVLTHCGIAMQTVGQEYERGLALCDRAVELNPNSVAVLIKAGAAHLIGGSLETARVLLHRAIDLHASDAYEAMGVLANVYVCLGEFELALPWARRSLALNPNYEPAHWMMVVANAHIGRLADAKSALALLLEIAPTMTIEGQESGAPLKDARLNALMADGFRIAGMPER